FVYRKNEESGEREKIAKTLGNIVDPMDVITRFSAEAFRYYFLRVCPYPDDGEFSWGQFASTYNADLANNLGNLYSRVVKLVGKNHGGVLAGTAGATPRPLATMKVDVATTVEQVRGHVEACRYHQALQAIWLQILDPANKHV